jgi:hypothetical protein
VIRECNGDLGTVQGHAAIRVRSGRSICWDSNVPRPHELLCVLLHPQQPTADFRCRKMQRFGTFSATPVGSAAWAGVLRP